MRQTSSLPAIIFQRESFSCSLFSFLKENFSLAGSLVKKPVLLYYRVSALLSNGIGGTGHNKGIRTGKYNIHPSENIAGRNFQSQREEGYLPENIWGNRLSLHYSFDKFSFFHLHSRGLTGEPHISFPDNTATIPLCLVDLLSFYYMLFLDKE